MCLTCLFQKGRIWGKLVLHEIRYLSVTFSSLSSQSHSTQNNNHITFQLLNQGTSRFEMGPPTPQSSEETIKKSKKLGKGREDEKALSSHGEDSFNKEVKRLMQLWHSSSCLPFIPNLVAERHIYNSDSTSP